MPPDRRTIQETRRLTRGDGESPRDRPRQKALSLGRFALETIRYMMEVVAHGRDLSKPEE